MCLAIPGKIQTTSESGVSRVARVDFGGAVREVSLDLLPEAAPGDYVLVHVGVAISRIDRHEAERTLELLRELGSLQDEIGEESGA